MGYEQHGFQTHTVNVFVSTASELGCDLPSGCRESKVFLGRGRKHLFPSTSTGDRYADDTTLMAERKEELKSLLMKVKEESKKLA